MGPSTIWKSDSSGLPSAPFFLMNSLCSLRSLWLNFFMRLAAAIIVVALFLGGCAGPPKNAVWPNATGAEQHERLMWEAIQKKDWANYGRHLSPTFIGVNAQGKMFDREGWLAYWKNSEGTQFSLGDVNVQPEGTDMKITYVLQPPGGEPLRAVSVWQQVNVHWIVTTTSLTPIRTN